MVADAAHRRQAGVQGQTGPQGAQLLYQPLLQHVPEAQVDAGVQPGAVGGEQGEFRPGRVPLPPHWRGLPVQQRGHAAAAAQAKFQGTLDALAVVGVESRRGLRVEPRQFRVQGRPAQAPSALLQFGAQGGIGRRQFVQAALQGVEIQHGAAHQQGHAAGGGDLRHGLFRVAPETPGRVGLGRFDQIDEPVRRARQRGRVRLGGADVHAPVHQGRIASVAASGFAVPMSMPRYTRAESTLMISSGKRSTSHTASSVLPLAVGPIRLMAVSGMRESRIVEEPLRLLASPWPCGPGDKVIAHPGGHERW